MSLNLAGLQIVVDAWAAEQTLPSEGMEVVVKITLAGAEVSTQTKGELLFDFLTEEKLTEAGVPVQSNLLRFRNLARYEFQATRESTVREFVDWCWSQNLNLVPNFGPKTTALLSKLLRHHGYISSDLG